MSTGDIDGDNRVDILLGTKWLGRTGDQQWLRHDIHPAPGDPDRNRLVDINGNGRLDAVVGVEAINKPGKLAWYEQPADVADRWIEHIISMDVVGPMSLDVADIDRDGDLDVVVGEHNYLTPETARLIIFEKH